MKNVNALAPFKYNLRATFIGLILAVATILFGQGLGIIFGLNEDAIKNNLKSSAAEVRESVYKADDTAIKTVLDKSWVYMQRSHLHAGAMGTTAIALILVISLLGISRILLVAVSFALGAGGLGYSIFWILAGFRAPGLGSTGAAKESLKWLAIPSSGAFVLATAAVLLVVLFSLLRSGTNED